MSRFRYLLLALLLLGGQVALLAHAADRDAHAAGEACEVCLHAASQDAGLLPAAVVVVPGKAAAVSLPHIQHAVVTARLRIFAARDPPHAFSA